MICTLPPDNYETECSVQSLYFLAYYLVAELSSGLNNLSTVHSVPPSASLCVHCYKTEGEIPVHTNDDAGRQRSTTGKYFRYESGVNTCFLPAVFNTSEIFP